MRRALERHEWTVVGLITLGAVALRLIGISHVSPDPFYDAAVRSMTLSWHNLFFGAFEPGASVSIDKPPLDLWLQVISVKVLGFSSTTLKLPEVFAGILTVPLLFTFVRRLWGAAAGLAAALAITVLPVEVITSRSDTMDAVMMALIVLALLLLVRACETGRLGWLLAAAAALGAAFDVKLLESVIALPALAVIAYLGLPAPRRRLWQLSAAAAVYVVVALSGSPRPCSCRRAIARGRSARVTGAPGMRRSCSTEPNASGANPRNRSSRSMCRGATTPKQRSPSATKSR
jgi:4-amino-4-deoxy-L-arabinose transferase-like glycosyltransferase